MHAALAVQESRVVVEGNERPVPDVRMDIKPACAVAPECHEPLRRDIIAGQGEGDDEALARAAGKTS